MWYVIQTMTGDEQRLMDLCNIQLDHSKVSYQLFVPMIIRQKHFRKEWFQVKKVMFPGYVFVDTEEVVEFIKGIGKIACFSKILKVGEEVTPVTRDEQEFLMSLMDEDYCVNYSQGFIIDQDVVVITEGALKNQRALIRKVDRHRRVAMLDVRMFGRMTPVEVGFGAFAKVTREEWEEIRKSNIREYQEKEVQKHQPEPGQLVSVRSGIFEGMTGRLLEIRKEKKECTVEIDLFGRATKVELKMDEVEGVEEYE